MKQWLKQVAKIWAVPAILAAGGSPCPGSEGAARPDSTSSYLQSLQPRTPSVSTPVTDVNWTRPPLALTSRQMEVLEAQIQLANRGFSPGSIDGAMGPNTRAAVSAFQRQRRLPRTGELDSLTLSHLRTPAPLFRDYVVSEEDLDRLLAVGATWLARSEQARLDHETLPEKIAEKAHCSPVLIQKLNPGVDWERLLPGVTLRVPNTESPYVDSKAAFLEICLGNRTLQAFDTRSNLMAHFPCSIGQNAAQRPVGELHVKVIIPDPNYTFNPAVFPESEEGRRLGRKLVIPPGPNNPVGTVWLGLDRPGYGIHGTPKPETVGRAESHGCFRLANWNVEHLQELCWISMPVYIVEECGD